MTKPQRPKKLSPRKNSKYFAPALPRAVVAARETDASLKPVRMIDRHEVMRRVPFTYPTLWKWMRDGKFPRSLNTGGKVCWKESDIDDWINSRPLQTIEGSKGEAVS
jgi:prophage regulatory protein